MNANTYRMLGALERLGVSSSDALALRRISMTLSKWAEHECNGTIQRDGDNGDGKPRSYYESHDGRIIRGSLVPDRERGAQRRLTAIMARYPHLMAYEQGDPRGAALYIIARDALGDRDASSCYSSVGVAVYA